MAAQGSSPAGLGLRAKLWLGCSIWFWSIVVRIGLRVRTLPVMLEWLCSGRQSEGPGLGDESQLRAMGRRVHRTLNSGPFRARCLVGSLVLLRLLRRAGTPAEIVIGLPKEPTSHEAHAWIEVGGVDVGPPPGRFGHRELSRYG